MTYTNKYFDEILQARHTPANNGERIALSAYIDCQRNGEAEYIIRDMGFAANMPEFMETLNAAGITEFIIADASTALMEILYILQVNGWAVCEPCRYSTEYGMIFGLCMRKAV